jgi:hypothetical protein
MNQILNDSTYSYQDIKDRVIPLKEGERIFWKEKRISDN